MLLLTDRLEIRIMTIEELKFRLDNTIDLKEAYHLNQIPMPLDEHMKKVYRLKIQRVQENPELLIYHTYYTIIDKKSRSIIGSLGLQGVYDEEGAVEIGYFLDSDYWNKGLMTEALNSVCLWLLSIPEILCIYAFTEKENFSSQAVLKKCDFEINYKEKDMILWNRTL